ncbi:MAG: crotonase/enoyl-CoA hydratase family protein [Thermoanaerobaculales bacterium]
MSAELDKAAVQYRLEGPIAVIRLDDGKVNALSHPVLDALHASLDRVEQDGAKAVVLVGREGRFSAGFDLAIMNEGIGSANRLALKGGELAIRIYDSPRPVVLGVSGHALAMGAILLMAADERIGADGPFKIGLNEVAIGMTLPEFALTFAEERLSRRHLVRATSAAELYSPADAVDAGFLDRVVAAEDVVSEAIARARSMADTLDAVAHERTKRLLRQASIERLRRSLEKGPVFSEE